MLYSTHMHMLVRIQTVQSFVVRWHKKEAFESQLEMENMRFDVLQPET